MTNKTAAPSSETVYRDALTTVLARLGPDPSMTSVIPSGRAFEGHHEQALDPASVEVVNYVRK